MKPIICLSLIAIFAYSIGAQSQVAPTSAANSVQPQAQGSSADKKRELQIPAGTPLEIESTYTVNSRDLRAGDFLSFRVLVPIKVDGVTAIGENALVTARVVKAKRGGHWGKAGKLVWTMQDVVAVDLTRVPLTFHQELGSQRELAGTSHGGQVATTAIVFGVLLFPASPLALMSGFKRGEDAILPQGHRFVVYVEKNTSVRYAPAASQ